MIESFDINDPSASTIGVTVKNNKKTVILDLQRITEIDSINVAGYLNCFGCRVAAYIRFSLNGINYEGDPSCGVWDLGGYKSMQEPEPQIFTKTWTPKYYYKCRYIKIYCKEFPFEELYGTITHNPFIEQTYEAEPNSNEYILQFEPVKLSAVEITGMTDQDSKIIIRDSAGKKYGEFKTYTNSHTFFTSGKEIETNSLHFSSEANILYLMVKLYIINYLSGAIARIVKSECDIVDYFNEGDPVYSIGTIAVKNVGNSANYINAEALDAHTTIPLTQKRTEFPVQPNEIAYIELNDINLKAPHYCKKQACDWGIWVRVWSDDEKKPKIWR